MLLQEIEKHASGVAIRPRYENFIGGKWVAPVKGQYFSNLSPIDGKPLCEVPRSTAEDIELALDAAHAAKDKWGQTSPGDRARVLNKIADRMEERHELLAFVETLRQRQTDPRDDCGRPAARHRSFPLFRRLHPRPGRHPVADRRRHGRLSFPRAARRRRPDHPVELSAPDGGLETRPGAWPPATAWCSSRPSRRRWASLC